MINEDDVKNIYKGLLDRNPEREKTIQSCIQSHKDISSLTKSIINSKEFKHKYMRRHMPERVVFFIHTPKTAGTYLRKSWIDNNTSHYFWFNPNPSPKKTYPTVDDLQTNYIEASSYELIGGHHTLETFLKMKTVQPRIFLNILRDPISRIISYYNFIKNTDHIHPLKELATTHSLYELLEKKTTLYNIAMNEQIKYLIARKESLERFSDRDLLIVGKQDSLDRFIEVANTLTGFKNSATGEFLNTGEEGYKKIIKAESDFPKALEILEKITLKERELYDSIEGVAVFNKGNYKDFVKKYQNA